MFSKSIMLFLLLSSGLLAQTGSLSEPSGQVEAGIEDQLDFFTDSMQLKGDRGREEELMRARLIGQLFFSEELRSYTERDRVLAIAERIQKHLSEFLKSQNYSNESFRMLEKLEQVLLEEYLRILSSSEFKDSESQMLQRSMLWGFIISPGGVFAAYLLGESLVLVGRGLDFSFYVLPKSVIRQSARVIRLSQAQWARWRSKEQMLERCRLSLAELKASGQADRKHLKRDFERAMVRWRGRLRPIRIGSYLAAGTALSAGIYHFPVPGMTDLSFEDQSDWDAQEDAMENILIPFFEKPR